MPGLVDLSIVDYANQPTDGTLEAIFGLWVGLQLGIVGLK